MTLFKKITFRIVLAFRFIAAARSLVLKNIFENHLDDRDYEREKNKAREAGLCLAEACSWRREIAFLNGERRISLRSIHFYGRCLHCKQNNKSGGACFFNKKVNGQKEKNDYEQHLNDLFAMWTHPEVGRKRHADEFERGFLQTFPDPDLLRCGTTRKRVATQHMMPSYKALLLGAGFKPIFPMNLFMNILRGASYRSSRMNSPLTPF